MRENDNDHNDNDHNDNDQNEHRTFWAKTCEDLRQRLLAYALWLVNGRDHEAEELVQETFCRTFMYLKDPETISNPFGYLRTILRNIWSTKWRKEGAAKTVSLDELLSKEAGQKPLRSVEPAVEPDMPRALLNDELREVVRVKQGPLKPREKLLLKLYLEGYTCEEIANILNEDVRLVRSDLNAVVAKVRYRLKLLKLL